MGFTGTYYQCITCSNIWDFSDTHCPNCGSQDETEISVREIKKIAEAKKIQALTLEEMLKNHDDF